MFLVPLLTPTSGTPAPPPGGTGSGYVPLLFLLFGTSGNATTAPAPILFGNELANFLRSSLGVNAYPVKLPQGQRSYPLLAYTLVDGQSDQILKGTSGLAFRSVQLDAYSPLYAGCEALSEQVRMLLQPIANAPMGRLTLVQADLERTTSGVTPTVSGQDSLSMYRFMSEWTFWFREAPL